MKIEITNTNTEELLEVIKMFPDGKLIVENNQALWVFNLNSKNISNIASNNSELNHTSDNLKLSIKKVQDYLFNAFS